MNAIAHWLRGQSAARIRAGRAASCARRLRGQARRCAERGCSFTPFRLEALADAQEAAAGGDRVAMAEALREAARYRRAAMMWREVA
jgi:hypothetical protein